MNPRINPARLIASPRSAGILESGLMALVSGQSYIDVVFPSALPGTSWNVLSSVINTTDATPLNIWPGIVSAKATTGFTVQLNGMPDSANYYLYWAIAPGGVMPDATTYTLTGPSSGNVGVASTNFTVALVGGGAASPVTVTPSAGGGGGTFTPTTVNLTTAAPSATFTYTPASIGAKTISVSNSGGLTNPGSLTYTASVPALADGDPVSTWHDSSTNGNDATMTGSNRPIFKSNVLLRDVRRPGLSPGPEETPDQLPGDVQPLLVGKPVVRFSVAGSSKLNLATPISGAAPWTIFAVLKGAGTSVALYCLGGSASGPIGILENSDAKTYFADQANIFPNSGGSYAGAFHVMTAQAAGGGVAHLWGNGISDAPSAGALVSSGNFSGIGWQPGTTTYSDGDIAEILIYNNAVGSTDRMNIEAYLGTKYGISVAGGSVIDPTTVAGLKGWWKADSLG